MTEAQKDKLWVDYFVTRFFWNKITNHNLPITGILDFHIEYESLTDAIHISEKRGQNNFQVWNWKWGERVFNT